VELVISYQVMITPTLGEDICQANLIKYSCWIPDSPSRVWTIMLDSIQAEF